MKLLLEHQMMDKSALICNTSSGKPVIPKKPNPPPKPNVSALYQSSHIRSTSRKDQTVCDAEPKSGKLMAVSCKNNNNGRNFTDLSNDAKHSGVKSELPYLTKAEDQSQQKASLSKNSGLRPYNEDKIVEKNTNRMLAVDQQHVGRSGEREAVLPLNDGDESACPEEAVFLLAENEKCGVHHTPDGSEVENSSKTENRQSSTAPLYLSEEKHCHCICHLHRPGMKLVWVPLQEEDQTCMETESRNSGGQPNTSPKKEDILKPTASKVYRPQDNPSQHAEPQTLPPCINCQSFLLHHSPHKIVGNGFIPNPSKPPVPAKNNYLSESQNKHQYEQLDNADTHIYLDLLPSNDSKVTAPPLPPRPPLRLSPSCVPKHKSERRSAQPALACVVSLRGGPPSRHCESGRLSRPISMPNSSGESYKNGNSEEWEVIDKTELCNNTESPRRISSDWEPNSDYEPLYQIYQAKVSEEAHQIHTDSPDCYRRSVGETLGLDGHGGLGVVGHRTKRGPEEIPLWQDLSVVKESGVLQKLNRTERQRQESMFEVLTSEASYLRSLRVLKDHFLGSRELNDTLVVHDKKALFSNILQVYEVSERFIRDLLNRVDESVVISDVCDIIYEHSEKYFSVYTDYVRNQHYQEKTYSSLMESNKDFSVVMKRMESSPLCRRLPFTSFMLLPFQRITRIKILLQSILKRTAKGTKEEETASKALASVSELIKQANSQVGQMKQMEELFHISRMLEFDKLKVLPIVSKTRCLEKQGEVQELNKRGSLFSMRNKCTPVYLFLFNDLLIFTTKKSGSPDKFVVIDYAHRSLVQVNTTETKLGLDHSFCLTMLENHRGNKCERLLKANTESDMHRWMAAFPSINVAPDEEKIYEDWDCPQVQCTSQYKARQADELSLEPSDVMNVLRKTNEGWYEGMRLSDREKGWFPAENVLEVTTDHQRRRNVREQYQIAQAINQNIQS